jgi:hypothetical protein
MKLTQLKLANGMLAGHSVWLSFIEYMIWVVFDKGAS